MAKFAINRIQHREESHSDAEVLANERRQTFAGDGTHAGAHLLHHDQADRNDRDAPHQGEAVFGAGLGISCNSAGVVTRRSGDDSGTENGKQDKPKGTPPGSRGRLCGGRGATGGGDGTGSVVPTLRVSRGAGWLIF